MSRLPPGDSVSTMVRATEKMRATVLHSPHHIAIEEVSRPRAGVGEAVIRITLTTICGTDLHIVRGEYPVQPGLVLGHEPVGVLEELGEGVTGYHIGDRVLVGAITPCGSAGPASLGSRPNADMGMTTKPLGAGASATPSMARRPNTCVCPLLGESRGDSTLAAG